LIQRGIGMPAAPTATAGGGTAEARVSNRINASSDNEVTAAKRQRDLCCGLVPPRIQQ
jgi:hypothetical protein